MKLICLKCNDLAVWYYDPNGTMYYCDEHVSRGCTCNIISEDSPDVDVVEATDNEGRLLPCCEFSFHKDGYDPEELSEISRLIINLPDNWDYTYNGINDEYFYDDGADYDKPFFIRKDKLARIYFNLGEENTDYMFGIAFENDGDCAATLDEAIKICEDYLK